MRKNKIKKYIAICFTFFLAVIGLINCKTYAYETNNKFTNTITSINYQDNYTYIGNELTNLSSLEVNAQEYLIIQFNNNNSINWSNFVILINTEIKDANQENKTGTISIQNNVGNNGYPAYVQTTLPALLTASSYNEDDITTLILKRTASNYQNGTYNTLQLTIPSGTFWKIYNIDILPASEIYTEYAMETYTQQYIEQINRLTEEKEELERTNTTLQARNNTLENENNLLEAQIESLRSINEAYNEVLPFTETNITNTTISVNGIIIPSNQTELYDTTTPNNNQISVSSDFDLLPNINTTGQNQIIYTYEMNKTYTINSYTIFGNFSDITLNEMQLIFYVNENETLNKIYKYIEPGEELEHRNSIETIFDKFQIILTFPEYSQIENNHDLEYGLTLGGTYEQGYQVGLENGLQTGYENGNLEARAQFENQIRALNKQITNLQDQVSKNYGWKQFFFGLVDIPFLTMSNVLGFELFGVNLFYAMIGILTTLIIIWLIKKFI